MKPKFVLLFVLFYTTVAYEQNYVPFPSENIQWNVFYASSMYGSPTDTILLKYTIQGDTIINEVPYHKLCKNIGSDEYPQYIFAGGLREQDKKVYYYGFGYSKSNLSSFSNKEYLLYDFNKNTGDSVMFDRERWYKIINIDSIKIGSNYRKRYEIEIMYSNRSEFIIEGIGDVNQGLLGMITPIPTCLDCHQEWYFICFSQNGENVYKNPLFIDCNSTQKWNDFNPLKTNTQWYYGEIDYPFYTSTIQYDNYNSLKSVGDTTILGMKYNILSQVRGDAGCASFESPAYAFQLDKTVYFYNSKITHFSTLYMYDAGKGDSWTVAYPLGDVRVMVDSVGTVETLGQTLKIQYVTYSTVLQTTYGYSEKSKIIENIGDVNYFFQSSLFQRSDWTCDEFGKTRTGLRCYIHPDLGTFSQGTLACDTVTTALSNTENKPVKVYFTSTNNLKIESEMLTEHCTFVLMDIQGSVLLQTEVDAIKSSVDFSNYNKGLYLYRLLSNGKLLKAGKVLKL